LVGNPEGKKPLGRPGSRWKDNIMDLRVIGCEDVYWFNMAQDRDRCRAAVNMVMILVIP
jgi:hypothetical protein